MSNTRAAEQSQIPTENTAKDRQKRTMPAITAVQRAQGVEARKRNAAKRASDRAKSTLRQNFGDDGRWQELAQRFNVRLPAWGVPATPASMKQWLKKLGLSQRYYEEWCGWIGPGAFQHDIDANPDWPIRAFAGLMLESQAHEAVAE